MTGSPRFHRTELLVGNPAMKALRASSAILLGIGGVGSWTAEALVRSGLGRLTIVDSDTVCITNANRQLQATSHNVGQPKVEELATRLRAIAPETNIVAHNGLYNEETKKDFDLNNYDYVVDAIDSLSPKLGLIIDAIRSDAILFSCMGASAKLDPTKVKTGSIWASEICPLARRIRKRLRRHGYHQDFQVVYSPELLPNAGQDAACGTEQCYCPKVVKGPDGEPLPAHEWCSQKAFINGSMVTVTATFGMTLASLVINDIVARARGETPTSSLSHKARKRTAASDESVQD